VGCVRDLLDPRRPWRSGTEKRRRNPKALPPPVRSACGAFESEGECTCRCSPALSARVCAAEEALGCTCRCWVSSDGHPEGRTPFGGTGRRGAEPLKVGAHETLGCTSRCNLPSGARSAERVTVGAPVPAEELDDGARVPLTGRRARSVARRPVVFGADLGPAVCSVGLTCSPWVLIVGRVGCESAGIRCSSARARASSSMQAGWHGRGTLPGCACQSMAQGGWSCQSS